MGYYVHLILVRFDSIEADSFNMNLQRQKNRMVASQWEKSHWKKLNGWSIDTV